MRKGFVLSTLVLFALTTAPAAAQADDDTTQVKGALLLAAGGATTLLGDKKEASLDIGVYGTLLLTTPTKEEEDGKVMLFAYAGPEVSFNTSHNVKLLFGTYFDGGTSLALSTWYVGEDVGTPGLNIFAEFDFYVPTDGKGGHEDFQFYAVAKTSYKVGGIAIGVAGEMFADTDEVFELAVGPSFGVGPLTLWLSYDWQPALKGEAWMLRTEVGVF